MPQARERARTLSRPYLAGRQEREVDRKAPFDQSTLVDAAELGEWLRLEADEVKILARAGVVPREAQDRFPPPI
jgi:hypothetical protein